MISLRFGSLTSFNRVEKSYGKVALLLSLRISSVFKVINRFVANGFILPADQRKRKRPPFFDPGFVRKLLDVDLMTKWAPLSLAKRVELILIMFDVTMTKKQLWSVYKQEGVTVRKAHTVAWCSVYKRPHLEN